MKRLPGEFKPGMRGLNKVLGNLESVIMDMVWNMGREVSVRDVFERLAARRKIAYTTVMTIMGRLADKNLLSKRKEGNTSFFLPTLSQEEFTDRVVGSVVDSLLEDFAEATLTHFIARVKSGDRDTIAKLERMLAGGEGNSAEDE